MQFMKKFNLISVLLFFALSTSFGKSIDLAALQTYRINSEVFSIHIPKGHFVLKGHIYDQNRTKNLTGAIISNQSQTITDSSKLNGSFQMLFPLSDTLIYCFKSGYNEVVIPSQFKDQHVIDVDIYLSDAIPSVCFKPVIYGYNAPHEFSLNLNPRGKFTYTYPESGSGIWNLRTNEDGTLFNLNDQKNYPYIFWEGDATIHTIYQSENTLEGFLIKTDTCISFLENTLIAYGLNEKESTDFIIFWGPRMTESPYALVQFLVNADYEKYIASLTINPQPETLLRLYMYLVPLQTDETTLNVVTPQIDQISRKGFTVIEWGGSVLQPDLKLN